MLLCGILALALLSVVGLATAPPPRYGQAAVYAAGKIWVHGGRGESLLDDLWQYDIDLEHWGLTNVSGGPGPRMHHVAVSEDDTLWLHGGIADGPLGDLWQFRISARTWSPHSPPIAPEPRGLHVAVMLQGRLWLHGGSGQTGLLGDTWFFDMRTETWSEVVGAGPTPRQGHVAMNEADQRVWIHGGKGGLDTLLADLWFFEVPAQTWAQMAVSPTTSPGARQQHAGIFAAGGLWLQGGLDSWDRWLPDLWRFDINDGTWTRKGPLAVGLPHPVAIYAQGRMWLLGLTEEGKDGLTMGMWTQRIPEDTSEEPDERIPTRMLFLLIWAAGAIIVAAILSFALTGEFRLLCLGPRWLFSPVGMCRCDLFFTVLCVVLSICFTLVVTLIYLQIFMRSVLDEYKDVAVSELSNGRYFSITNMTIAFIGIPLCFLLLLAVFVAYQRLYDRRVLRPLEENFLVDPRGLAKFLVDADIHLVRFEFLLELRNAGKSLVRRQEAQKCSTKSGDGALVPHAELLQWAQAMHRAPTNQRVVSVSHSWESREHPDPWNYQLNYIVDALEPVWRQGLIVGVFYDYCSVYQFKRFTKHEMRSFARSMDGMHIMYAHDWTHTLCIEKMTPEELRTKTTVNAYFVDDKGQGRICEKEVDALTANDTPYLKRGWCIAELQWSSLRSAKVDWGPLTDASGPDMWSSYAPLPPDFFRKTLSKKEVKFTHRSDTEVVIRAQQKAFASKAGQCTTLQFRGLPTMELDILADALHHYSKITELCLSDCDLFVNESAVDLRLSRREELRSVRGFASLQSFHSFMRRLNFSASLRFVSMVRCNVGDVEVECLSHTLRSSRWSRLDLGENHITNTGAENLAANLNSSCLEVLHLSGNAIGDSGCRGLAKAWALPWIREIFSAWRETGHDSNAMAIGSTNTLGSIVQTAASLPDHVLDLFTSAAPEDACEGTGNSLRRLDLSRNPISEPCRLLFCRPAGLEVLLGRHLDWCPIASSECDKVMTDSDALDCLVDMASEPDFQEVLQECAEIIAAARQELREAP